MAQDFENDLITFNLNRDEIKKPPVNTCISCLKTDVPLIVLANCEHTEIFDFLLDYKVELIGAFICYACHNVLKKIQNFKIQVNENVNKLCNETKHQSTTKTAQNLEYSSIEINSTINSQPIETEIIKPTKNNVFIEIPMEIKTEPSSEYKQDSPITVKREKPPDLKALTPLQKKLKAQTLLQKLTVPYQKGAESTNNDVFKQIPTEIKIKPSLQCKQDSPITLNSEKSPKVKAKTPLQKKYEGKVKIVMLSMEEMLEERKEEALKKSYLNLPYKCEYCITGFDHELTLKNHMEKRHAKKSDGFECKICNTILGTKTSYDIHHKRHFKRYQCVECEKRNIYVYAVLKHCDEEHGGIKTKFTCKLCDFTTESHKVYRSHRIKHRAKKVECRLCGNSFASNSGLTRHMFTVHRQSSRVYACEQCGKQYRAKSGLAAHAAAHAPAAPAYCATCDTHFRTALGLKYHLKHHSRHSEQRFACNECDAKFILKSSLQDHINWVHLNNTEHTCNKCMKVFVNSSKLKKHRDYVHEKKERPRNKICDHCGRGFTALSILRSHIRTHTGERPLQCTHCPATFAHSAALYTHNKLLHSKT